MRQFSSSWMITLGKLGFRRRQREHHRHPTYRRRPRIENLEARAMLATYTVDSLEDNTTTDQYTTLREAVALANANSNLDEIRFDLSLLESAPVTIALSSQLTISNDVAIIGLGAESLILDGGLSHRVLVVSGSQTDVNISGLTIQRGTVTGSTDGGGIHNAGNLKLEAVVMTDNHSGRNAGALHNGGTVHIIDSTLSLNTAVTGGAISSKSDATNSVVIEGSAIISNTAANAGGIRLDDISNISGPSATIINSTLSGNTSSGSAGAIQTTPYFSLKIVNSTITENSAGTEGGGIRTSGASVTLHNTILADNDAGVAGTEDHHGTQLTSISSYNLIGPNVSVFGAGDGVGTRKLLTTETAGLAPLGDYGGRTKTHALTTTSLAIDHGIDTEALAYDGTQLAVDSRGFDRRVDDLDTGDGGGGTVDIGAFEFGAPIIVSTLVDENDGNYTPGDLSLREALALAAVLDGPNTIVFDPSLTDGTITLGTLGQLVISTNVVIAGPGIDQLTVSGNHSSRVFKIETGASVEIQNLTMADGYTTGTSISSYGGAIHNTGNLVIVNSAILNSSAMAVGGIYSTGGSLELRDSRVEGNVGGASSGVAIQFATQLIVERSSIIGNTSALHDGGITAGNVSTVRIVDSTVANNNTVAVYNSHAYAGVVIENADTVEIANTTISGNDGYLWGGLTLLGTAATTATLTNVTVAQNIGDTGAGVKNALTSGAVTLHNTIVAQNGSGGQLSGAFGSASSYNLIGVDTTVGNGIDHDTGDGSNNYNIVGTAAQPIDPKLAPLGEYGGPTKTHAILADSLAINAGSNSAATTAGLTLDQRGFERTVDGTVDIGAVELAVIVAPVADFDGNGRNDYATFDDVTGSIVVYLGDDAVARTGVWAQLPASISWDAFQVGDFNGDGRDDLLVRDATSDDWTLALSESTLFLTNELGIAGAWTELHVGDFDGDGADELLGWNDTADEWEMLHYDEQFAAMLDAGSEDWGDAIEDLASANPIRVGDANRDGRDDLITGTNGQWYVGLSKVDGSGNGYFEDASLETDWGGWFDNYFVSNSLNADGPIQKLIEEFSKVYNGIELELYRGLMKGPAATEQTGRGNDWDQAALLVSKLPDEFDAAIVSGDVTISLADAEKWVGATDEIAVEAIIKAAFDADAVVADGEITFRHAWVRATLPTASGLETVDLDPSWKFKRFQAGIESLNEFDEFAFLAQAGRYFKDLSGSELNARELPLEFFEDEITQDLIENHTGSSLADVGYNGPIVQKTFAQIPVWEYADAVSGVIDHGTFAEIVAGGDSEELTHRVRIFVGTNSSTPTALDWSGILPNISLDSIVVENREAVSTFESMLLIDGVETDSDDTLSATASYKLYVGFLLPGETAPDHVAEWNVYPEETLAISLGVNQHSIVSLSDKIEAALEIEGSAIVPDIDDIGDLLAYAGAKYWYDVDTSSAAIADLTHTARIKGVQAALLRASGELDPRGSGAGEIEAEDIQRTPFNLFPESISMDVIRATDGQNGTMENVGTFLTLDEGAIHGEAVQLFAYQYSALEHSIMEEVVAADGVSAVKLLQMAFAEALQVEYFDGQNEGLQNHIQVLEYLVNPTTGKVQLRHAYDYRHHDSGAYEDTSDLRGSEVDGVFNVLWTADSTWSGPTWTPTTTDLEHSSNGLWARLNDFFSPNLALGDDGRYPGDVSGELRYEMVRQLAGEAKFVIDGTASRILIPKSRVRVGDVDNYTGGSGDTEWWQGAGYIVDHTGGRFKMAVMWAPDAEILDGGAKGGNPITVTQPEGSFVNQTSTNRVSTANGNVWRQDTDILFPNIGVRMDFSREYNAQSIVTTRTEEGQHDVGFGVGWTHSFSDRLIYWGTPNGSTPDLVWYTSAGTRHHFEYEGGYITPPELQGELEWITEGNDRYVFVDREGIEYHFERVTYDSSGDNQGELRARLLKKVDNTGHGFAITYDDANGKPQNIAKVEDYYGTPQDPFSETYTPANETPGQHGKLVFEYDASPSDPSLIRSIKKYDYAVSSSVPIGTWDYEYDSLADLYTSIELDDGDDGMRLAKVTSATDAFITTPLEIEYEYYGDDVPEPVHGLLKQVTEPDDHYRIYEYYHNGRAFRVTSSIDLGGAGISDDVTVSNLYAFNFVQGRTHVIDPLDRATTFIHQNNGLETRQIYADRTRSDTAWGVYDEEDELIEGTDYLMTSTTDEVGAVQTFTYYEETDGFKDRQLKQSTSKHFVDSDGVALEPETVVVTTYDYLQGTAYKSHLILREAIVVDAPDSTDPNIVPLVTTYSYDSFGRPTSIEDPLGNTTIYDYFDVADVASDLYLVGLLKSQTSPKGVTGSEAVAWRVLYEEFVITGDTLEVQLAASGATGEVVVADAIRIDRVDEDQLYKQVIDDSDGSAAGFELVGTHSEATVSQPEYNGSATRITGTGSATWTFTNLKPGTYRVSAVWTSHTDQDTAAQYEITDPEPSGAQETVYVNQQNTPAEPVEEEISFGSYQTTFEYDAAGNLTATIYEGFVQQTGEFDHNGNPILMTDRTGVSTFYESDILGRQHTTGLADPDGPTNPLAAILSTHKYDAGGRRISTTDPRGNTTQFEYDGRNLVVERTNRDGTTATFVYDDVGNMVSRTDELGRITSFVYDSRNRLIQVIHPDGASEHYRYDGAGRLVALADANGHESQFTFDAAGRLLTSTNANPNTSENTATNVYDDLGRLASTLDYEGHETVFEYDALGRVVQTRVLADDSEDPPLSLATTEYDAHGNVVRTIVYDAERLLASDGADLGTLPDTAEDLIELLDTPVAVPYLREMRTIYDTQNRAVEMIHVGAAADGLGGDVSTRAIYDGAGRVRFTIDELGRESEMLYGAYGRLEQTVSPDPDAGGSQTSPIVTRTYDEAGNVLTVTDANGHVTTNEYDVFNRLVATTDAEGNTTRSVYDIAGQVVATVSALGHAFYTAYDQRGRVQTERKPDPDGSGSLSASVTKYVYDAVGNRISMTGPNGYITRFEYDELNRLKKEISTDVLIADIVAHDNDPYFEVTTGNPNTVGDVETSFGRDYTDVAGTGSVAPEAGWTFENLDEGTYRVAITWETHASLDATAEVEIYVNGTPLGSALVFSQQESPNDVAFDYQGQWLGWKVLAADISLSAGDDLEIRLVGSGTGTGVKIRADAVMLDRVVEKSYAFDGNGNVTTQTETLGRTTINEYDELGRVVKTTHPDPDGGSSLQSPVSELVYDGFGNVTKVIERRGSATDRTETRTYDKRNRLTGSIANYQDGVFSSASTDEDIITQNEFDDAGNLLRVINAVDSDEEIAKEFEYDNLNRLTAEFTEVGSLHHQTEYEYDAVGNKTRSESIIHDPNDSDVASTVTTYEYDDINRLVKQVDDVGTGGNFVNVVSLLVYDAVGNVVQKTDPTGRITTFEYDRLNRLTQTTLPDPDGPGSLAAPTTTVVYDVLGNTVRATNGEGETNQSIYDTRGREISKFDAAGNETRYFYDSEGKLLRFTDASGNETRYTYDALSRVLTITNQLSDARSKTYDDTGNVVSVVDRTGRVRKFTYDDLDRLTKEEWFVDAFEETAVETLTWQYDALGRVKLAKHVQGASTVLNVDTYDYDALGRLTQRRNYDPNGDDTPGTPDAKLTYTYDQIINGSGLWYATAVTQWVGSTDVATTTYSTDRLGRLAKINDDVLEEASSDKSDKQITFTYDAAGRLMEVERRSVHNGSAYTFFMDTTYSYDGTGRLQTIDHHGGSGDQYIAGFAYAYDAASRIVEIDSEFMHTNIKFTRDEDFTYDDAGRLTNLVAGYVNLSGTTLGFAIDNDFLLDATGNRTSTAVDGGSAVSANIDPNNQLANDGTFAYFYDDEGNLFQRTRLSSYHADDKVTQYAWDHRNRLTKVTIRDSTFAITQQIDYTYNDGDLRVRRTVSSTFDGSGNPTNAVAEHFVYDGDQVAMLVESDGDVDRRYLYAGTDELLVDEVFNEAGTVGQAERGYWAFTDHAGTVHDLIESDADGDGTDTLHFLKQHLDYDSSGKIVRAINSNGDEIALDALFSEYAFAGREWDGDAGLYYNRARWYDANSGRFISEDPIGFEGGDANLYRYAAGDPVNFLDPTGRSWFSSLGRKIGNAFERSIDFAEDVINNPDDFIDNLDEMGKGLIKDPFFWAGLAVGPLFAANIGWGAFEVGFGLGGVHAGPNWFKALGDAWGLMSGGGFSMGVPTLNVASPVFNKSMPLFSPPAGHSLTIGQFEPEVANSRPQNADYDVLPAGAVSGEQIPSDVTKLDDALDGARMSQRSYTPGNMTAIGDWQHTGRIFRDKASGGQAVLFYNPKRKVYALAFAGTEGVPTLPNPATRASNFEADWTSNVRQRTGRVARQYDWAVGLTGSLKKTLNQDLMLVGHSLGGGLATASAAAHQLPAITFNPANLNRNSVARYGSQEAIRRHVTSYHVQGELLTHVEKFNSSQYRYGFVYALPARPGTSSVGLHSIDSSIWGIQVLRRAVRRGENPQDYLFGKNPNSQAHMFNSLLYEQGL